MYRICLSLLLFSILKAGFIGDAGYGFHYYQYTEPGLMQIRGNLHTIYTRVGYLGDSVGFDVNYDTVFDNNTFYYGSTMSGAPILHVESKDRFWDSKFRFGSTMNFLSNGSTGLAYIGFGYRYLKNKVINEGGYTREQIYYYIPIGFYMHDKIVDNFYARYGLEIKWLFNGVNKTHLGEVLPTIDIPVMKFIQKNNLGINTHLGFEYKIDDIAGFFAQVKVEYLYVKDSNTIKATYTEGGASKTFYFLEPENNTLQAGIELGFTF